ncbi:hypothetical protein D3C77_544040 [compost metagenome]
MGKLTLDNVRIKAFFIQGGGGQRPEPVRCGNPPVTHPPHSIAQGIFAHGVGQLALTREQQIAMTGYLAQLIEHGQRLPG